MCIALPCKLVKIEGNQGIAELGGSQVKMRLDLLPDAQLGDYVLVHAGFAIEKLDQREAQETLDMLDQVGWPELFGIP